MTQPGTPLESFRYAVGALLSGTPPNGVTPADVAEWGETLSQLYTAHAAGGTPAVVRTWNALTAADKRLLKVVSAPMPVAEELPSGTMPTLPVAATAVYEHTAPCAEWLESYIQFAQHAAPMGPRSFHELAGLFATSLAIARRLVFRASAGDIYPNLFALWLGEPAIYSKTSSLRALVRLIHDAGVRHLLLPEKLTPEALMLQCSLSIPQTLENWQPEAREAWLHERAYAARRGWVLDEAGRLFSSLKQDYNAGLLGLLLQLYDCPDTKDEETTGRGRIVVSDSYLSFFGVATPHGMAEHLRNRALWENGLWSRFALVTPDDTPPWQFLGEHVPIPSALLHHYRAMFDLFPARVAELIAIDDSKRSYVRVIGQDEPVPAELEPGVFTAWEAYAKATRYDMLLTGGIDRALFGSYGRFGTHAMKVAMLLATMDTAALPVRVELRHWVRAQQIVEGWRANLHRLWHEGTQIEEHHESDRILERIAAAGESGILPRDVYRPLNMKASDANLLIDELEKAGKIEKVPGFAGNRRPVVFVRMASYTKPEVS